jgi:protein-tyrosine phosphatase
MPMKNVNNEHEQLVSILNQLMDEREMLSRENEYLKAKLNESVLIETINEMKQERDLLFKLLSNVTTKYSNDKQLRHVKQHLKEKYS